MRGHRLDGHGQQEQEKRLASGSVFCPLAVSPPKNAPKRFPMIRTPLMNVMTAAAAKAARGLKRDFGEVAMLQVSRKGPADFVSAADKKSEKVLFEELSRARPGYSFKMEESGIVEGKDKTHI
eukprot:gene55412-73995_t